MVRIGVVGHRELRGDRTSTFVADASRKVLAAAKRRFEVCAVSALAEGADTLFAEEALALGIPLRVVTPFRDYEADFESTTARRRYTSLRDAAEREERLPYATRSRRAYRAAMRWVVENSDLLVAAWDGRPGLGPGGTADAVHHAHSVGRPVVHLDVTALAVRPCGRPS